MPRPRIPAMARILHICRCYNVNAVDGVSDVPAGAGGRSKYNGNLASTRCHLDIDNLSLEDIFMFKPAMQREGVGD